MLSFVIPAAVKATSFPSAFLIAFAFAVFVTLPVCAQQPDPVVVRPGAPGQPTKVLPSSTRGKLPPVSRKDVEFMQGMIHHHAQAVEMVDLIASLQNYFRT